MYNFVILRHQNVSTYRRVFLVLRTDARNLVSRLTEKKKNKKKVLLMLLYYVLII